MKESYREGIANHPATSDSDYSFTPGRRYLSCWYTKGQYESTLHPRSYLRTGQQAPVLDRQRAAAARQREVTRRQAELSGATLLPGLDLDTPTEPPVSEAACEALATAESDPDRCRC